MTDQARSGAVDLGSGKKQHVDLWRKVKLRRELLADVGPQAAFVPFLGEGDIAAELYGGRHLAGVELDPDIADGARARLANVVLGGEPIVIAGDAEQWHRAAADAGPFAVLDVDAFSNPYIALDVAWKNAPLADVVAIFGTDGMRLAIRQSKTRTFSALPRAKIVNATLAAKREQWNKWWTSIVRPYLEQLVAPGRIVRELKYQRLHMLYFGVIVDRRATTAVTAADPPERPSAPPVDDQAATVPPGSPREASAADIEAVENALLEAARSGNVPAAIFWLEHKGGETWRPTKTTSAAAMLEELTGTKARPKR